MRQLFISVLAGLFLYTMPCSSFAQQPIPRNLTTKGIYVLFPHSRDAQYLTVSQDTDGKYIYQGDIRIDTAQIIYDTSNIGTRPVELALQMRRLRFRKNILFSAADALWWDWGIWEDGVIPYKVSDNMPQPFKDLIARAVNHINTHTNLCMRVWTRSQSNYIEFIPVKNKPYSGSSPLGKTGGRQAVELDIFDTTFNTIASFRTVVHESMHAAGFIHEQSRSDRDDFVEILPDNIDNDMGYNFDKDAFSRNLTAYDFQSIMHYNRRSFGKRDTRGNRMVTIRTRNSRDRIDPSNRLTRLDRAGVNSLYPVNADCNERVKKIKSISLNSNDGLPGGEVYDQIVSSGWSDAEPIMVNGRLRYMMFLNSKNTYAEIRSINNDGSFSEETAYSKDWQGGWADIEMLYLNNTTYILHQKRFPLLEDNDYYPHGLTRISRVNVNDPFADSTLGTKVYDNTWGVGWSIIKFFFISNTPYMFRYNKNTNVAHVYRIDAADPFNNNRVGTKVYDQVWTPGWTVVRFFDYNNKMHCFQLKSETGEVKISEISNTDPFSNGSMGTVRFEDTWTSGWTNVNIYTNTNNKTYMFLQKSQLGKAKIMEFRAGDAFSARYPFTDIYERTWTKGWTYTKIYYAGSGYKLLHMKK